MSDIVVSVENLSKIYRLGQIGTGTFRNDVQVWWARRRGKPNPLLKIGQVDHGNQSGETIWALKDVSFSVEQGGVLGIIGRNGAGKSTLLKILSRVTAPTDGKIKVKGRVASLLEVGTGFHPELTGRENIYLNGAILGMTRREVERKFDEIVDFSGVEQFIDTPVKRYSSGMYVRLAFAVAAHLDPEILVVDEVLAVGDAEFQKKCLGKMGEVAGQGRTILFVSHNMAAIEQLTKRALVFEAGILRINSKTEDAIATYMKGFNATESRVYTPSNSKRITIVFRRIEFIEVEFAYTRTNIFSNNDNISIFVKIKGNDNVDNFRFNLTIFKIDGTPIGSILGWTNLNIRIGEIKKYIIRLPKLFLAPGNYYFGISVGKGSYHETLVDFDILLHVLEFTMKYIENGMDYYVSWTSGWGYLNYGRLDILEVEI